MPEVNPNPTQSYDGPAAGRRIARHGESISLSIAGYLAATARIIAPMVAAIVALAVVINAGAAIARLFARMGADPIGQALAAAASVGVLLALAGLLTLSQSANLRALAVIYAVAWLPLVLALVGLEAALSSAIVAVPAALAQAGRTIAALLAGLALLPAITIAVASARPDGGDVRAALAYYVSNALKLVLLVATSAANISFGLSRGVPLEVSLFVAVVLETGLILALLRAQQGALHALALLVFGGAVSLVAVETLAVLSGLAALPELARIGEAIYLLTPALAIAYIVATALSERKRARDHAWSGIMSWAAGQVRGARVGLATLRGAAREPIALPGQPQPDQVDDQVDADQPQADQPAYSLNGQGPK